MAIIVSNVSTNKTELPIHFANARIISQRVRKNKGISHYKSQNLFNKNDLPAEPYAASVTERMMQISIVFSISRLRFTLYFFTCKLIIFTEII